MLHKIPILKECVIFSTAYFWASLNVISTFFLSKIFDQISLLNLNKFYYFKLFNFQRLS